MIKEFSSVSGHERTGTGRVLDELSHFKFSNPKRLNSLNKLITILILIPSHHSLVNDPNLVITYSVFLKLSETKTLMEGYFVKRLIAFETTQTATVLFNIKQ